MTLLNDSLLAIISSSTLAQVAQTSLRVLIEILHPQKACLLIWDHELERFIVGETWLVNDQGAPVFRREALRIAHKMHEGQRNLPDNDEIVYQSLQTEEQLIGALVCVKPQLVPDDEYYNILLQVICQTLKATKYLEQVRQEQIRMNANQQRLEHLLLAVEQHQHTIDALLSEERQFSSKLEAQVEERTIALRSAQTRLIQSEKLAAIGELAGHLAHEINNPLQAIRSGLDLVIVEMEEQTCAHEDLQIIRSELERIEAIFRQMMDFYRPTTFDFLPLDLNAICESMQVLMRKRLASENVRLELRLTSNLQCSCGDSNQIKQVLLNLLLNAADAMPPKGGQIIVRTGFDEKSNLLQVIDNGNGIAPEHRQRLFEPLYTTKTHGMGMGLAISQDIVHRHEGTIYLEDHPENTVLTVRLPIQECGHESFKTAYRG